MDDAQAIQALTHEMELRRPEVAALMDAINRLNHTMERTATSSLACALGVLQDSFHLRRAHNHEVARIKSILGSLAEKRQVPSHSQQRPEHRLIPRHGHTEASQGRNIHKATHQMLARPRGIDLDSHEAPGIHIP